MTCATSPRLIDDLIGNARRDAALLSDNESTTPDSLAIAPSIMGPRLIGPAIQDYLIICEVRRGGQGTVYKAERISSGETVAIKVLDTRSSAGLTDLARFDREVHALRKINHPNIVPIQGLGTVSDRPYLVMPFIDGWSLEEFIATRGPTVRETMLLFEQVCQAVHAAHLCALIHRDLKPGNIRIDPAGRPHILDFGLAKLADGADPHSAVTEAGQFLGSLPWASPEQAECRADPIDLGADVYSLGAVLYFMLTGEPPLDSAGSVREVLDRIALVAPIPPSRLRPGVGRDIDTIVLRCLSKEPDRRYQSASELAAEIRRWLVGQPIEARRESWLYVTGKFIMRHRLPVALASLLAISLTGGGAMLVLQHNQALRDEQKRQESAAFAQCLPALIALSMAAQQPGSEQIARESLGEIKSVMSQFPRDRAAELESQVAFVCATAGLFVEARDLAEAAVHDATLASSAMSPAAIRYLSQQARYTVGGGNGDLAAKEAAEVLALSENARGKDSDFAIEMRSDFADTPIRAGDLDLAEHTLIDNLGSIRRAPVQTDKGRAFQIKYVAELLRDVGVAALGLGQDPAECYARARELQSEALAIARRVFSADPARLAHHLLSFSVLLGDAGDLEQADALGSEALAIREKLIPPESEESLLRYAAASNVGAIRLLQGDYGKSEELLLDAYNHLWHGRPIVTLREQRAETAGRLAELYKRWDRIEPDTGHLQKASYWRDIASQLGQPPP